jgi:hypothetical protein
MDRNVKRNKKREEPYQQAPESGFDKKDRAVKRPLPSTYLTCGGSTRRLRGCEGHSTRLSLVRFYNK